MHKDKAPVICDMSGQFMFLDSWPYFSGHPVYSLAAYVHHIQVSVKLLHLSSPLNGAHDLLVYTKPVFLNSHICSQSGEHVYFQISTFQSSKISNLNFSNDNVFL